MQQTLAPARHQQQTPSPQFGLPQFGRLPASRKLPRKPPDPRGAHPPLSAPLSAPLSTSLSTPDSGLLKWGLARLAGSLVEISGTADSGVLSSALALVAEAQHHQARHHKKRHGLHPGSHPDPAAGPALVAWVATTHSLFFPPDALESGIALERLVLLRLETPAAQIRAATRIVHSGAFGLVIVDLADSVQPQSPARKPIPESIVTSPRLQSPRTQRLETRNLMSRPNTPLGVPPLSRLAGLAHKYRTAVVLLTDKPPAAPSIDPRVGKRFDASRRDNDIVITVLKDKGSGGSSSPEFPPLRGRDRLFPGFRFERKHREPAGMC